MFPEERVELGDPWPKDAYLAKEDPWGNPIISEWMRQKDNAANKLAVTSADGCATRSSLAIGGTQDPVSKTSVWISRGKGNCGGV